ncbi:MAG: 4Fe-4S dicluster domain-containing protein [Chloroflexota bacterium]
MKNQSRRDFIRNTAVLGAAAAAGSSAGAAMLETPENSLTDERMGVLVDTAVCIGCRNCEWACKAAHDIDPGDLEDYADRSVYKEFRRPHPKGYTVINEFPNPKNELLPIDVKYQCMHCDHPACVSACIVGAFEKMKSGEVIWNTEKCIGCRYCMVACPFQIPTFEFSKAWMPNITKCDFCHERRMEGKIPACVGICPVETMTFGKREDIIRLAHERIASKPDVYIDHVFGEHEVGGTAWVYIAPKDFHQLGYPKLNEKPAPGVSESIQHGIFAYFVPPVALYSLLGALMWMTKKRADAKQEEDDDYGA